MKSVPLIASLRKRALTWRDRAAKAKNATEKADYLWRSQVLESEANALTALLTGVDRQRQAAMARTAASSTAG